MGWATVWAIFSQTRLVTLVAVPADLDGLLHLGVNFMARTWTVYLG
jgi:hypothetical protein